MRRPRNKFLLPTIVMAGLWLLPSPGHTQEVLVSTCKKVLVSTRKKAAVSTCKEVPQTTLAAPVSAPPVSAPPEGKYSSVRAKRLWTNDDFPSFLTPESEPKTEGESAATAPEPEGAEIQQVRQEVTEEMRASARARQKAYEDTLSLVQSKLETETNPFRIKVYQQILEDTAGLQKINQHLLEQFQERAGGEGEEPSAPAESQQALLTAMEPR